MPRRGKNTFLRIALKQMTVEVGHWMRNKEISIDVLVRTYWDDTSSINQNVWHGLSLPTQGNPLKFFKPNWNCIKHETGCIRHAKTNWQRSRILTVPTTNKTTEMMTRHTRTRILRLYNAYIRIISKTDTKKKPIWSEEKREGKDEDTPVTKIWIALEIYPWYA